MNSGSLGGPVAADTLPGRRESPLHQFCCTVGGRRIGDPWRSPPGHGAKPPDRITRRLTPCRDFIALRNRHYAAAAEGGEARQPGRPRLRFPGPPAPFPVKGRGLGGRTCRPGVTPRATREECPADREGEWHASRTSASPFSSCCPLGALPGDQLAGRVELGRSVSSTVPPVAFLTDRPGSSAGGSRLERAADRHEEAH